MASTKDYFFNPVKVMSDTNQLVTGSAILIISILVSYVFCIDNDGVYHSGFASRALLFQLLSNVSIVLLPTIFLFLGGKLFNKGTRFVDITNAVLFSRIPLLVGYVIGAICIGPTLQEKLRNEKLDPFSIPTNELMKLAISGLLVLPLLVYSFILLVNGLRTAIHSKKSMLYAMFAVGIIVSEILYRYLVYPYLN